MTTVTSSWMTCHFFSATIQFKFVQCFHKRVRELNLEINWNKLKIVRFNPLKSAVMKPNIPLPLTSNIRILGLTFSNDFSFAANIENVVQSANASLQILYGIRRFSANTESIKYAYLTYVHPTLEYAYLVWVPSILRTMYLCQELESVQKRVIAVILDRRDIPR